MCPLTLILHKMSELWGFGVVHLHSLAALNRGPLAISLHKRLQTAKLLNAFSKMGCATLCVRFHTLKVLQQWRVRAGLDICFNFQVSCAVMKDIIPCC